MDFTEFVKYLLFGLLAGVAGYVINQINKLTDSVVKLNINLAVILEKMVHHDKLLDKHDLEIENLKTKQIP